MREEERHRPSDHPLLCVDCLRLNFLSADSDLEVEMFAVSFVNKAMLK